MKRFSSRPDFFPAALLVALCTLFWWRVLFTGEVLLPDYLRGFAPFGSDANAPWNLLRWDSLGQYFPWRAFAARELSQGHIPLWNPHQFAGTPFVANGQSAIFYPLSLPFWLFDTARAFGISAWLHSLLATLGTYALARHWQFGRAAALLAAIVFAFSGYLTTWVSLPTLSDTASWLPLLLLLFERARHEVATPRDRALFALGFACAFLAGHPQIFFYCGCALALRALLCPRPGRAFGTLAKGSALCLALAAIQILPTFELARLGHRAATGGPSLGGWNFVQGNALPPSDYLSLFFPGGPLLSYSENFGYVGVFAALLALVALGVGIFGAARRKSLASEWVFCAALALFGLFYALATPLAQAFYFTIPGLSQMGGTGRAFVLWTLGVALLAAYSLEIVRTKVRSKSTVLGGLVLGVITLELFAANWGIQPTAPRERIYPTTKLTTFLQKQTEAGGRVLFITPRANWLPGEVLRSDSHPRGVMPPNGAMVYGLNDVNGYDSLSLLGYRRFVGEGEGAEPSPPLNGNMILLQNVESPALDALDVRWVVSNQALDSPSLGRPQIIDNCHVYERNVGDIAKIDGSYFAPGWRALSTSQTLTLHNVNHRLPARVSPKRYDPQSFRLGAFVSLMALFACAMAFQLRPKKL